MNVQVFVLEINTGALRTSNMLGSDSLLVEQDGDDDADDEDHRQHGSQHPD